MRAGAPRNGPTLEELQTGAPPEQILALSVFHVRFFSSPDFVFDGIFLLPSSLRVILCHHHEVESAVLPIFHGFQIRTRDIFPMLGEFPRLPCLLALCAADSSVILYQVRDFDFPVPSQIFP
jgi:hypothetical protein